MKIIYDEEKILKEREKEISRVNKERGKYTRWLIISFGAIVLLFSLLGYGLHTFEVLTWFVDYVAFGAMTAIGISLIMVFIATGLEYKYDTEYYEKPSYKYYNILDIYKNSTLLSQDINEDALELRFKDKESYITRRKIYLKEMQKREKDDINEIIINFNLNEIWIPYKEKEVI